MVKATFSIGRPQASMASCNVVVTDDDGNIDVTMAKHRVYPHRGSSLLESVLWAGVGPGRHLLASDNLPLGCQLASRI